MSTPNAQLPIPKALQALRLSVFWELEVGSWGLSQQQQQEQEDDD
jgi:hypothetical protein